MKAVSVIGTRPQYVKAAMVTAAFRRTGRVAEVTIDTGQHFDHEMTQLVLADLGDFEPRRNLSIGGPGRTDVLARMISALSDALRAEEPDCVVVYGDTNSTLAAAVAATTLNLPVAHVEAGLRSNNLRVPEEQNRIVVDHVSRLRLCPTPTAVANLRREGIVAGVHDAGDVMYDAALAARAAIDQTTSELFETLAVEPGQYAVATLHRAENTDDPAQLRMLLDYLVSESTGSPIVFPVHPRTRHAIGQEGLRDANILTCPPLGYLDMTRLVAGARRVYTDSGGLQKEAYFHRVSCVTLRSETEWTETIEAGWNRLWTVPDYQPRRPIPDYGDGHAAETIANLVLDALP